MFGNLFYSVSDLRLRELMRFEKFAEEYANAHFGENRMADWKMIADLLADSLSEVTNLDSNSDKAARAQHALEQYNLKRSELFERERDT